MIIRYGKGSTFIDVTDLCMQHLRKGNRILIPSTDVDRAKIFGDPVPFVVKVIQVQTSNGLSQEIPSTQGCSINVVTGTNESLEDIQRSLKLNHGSFKQELPEQRLSFTYIHPNSHVLELGGNIGRNSLIIASILKNGSGSLVVFESDPTIASQLQENRDLNGLTFAIEKCALSEKRMIQAGWSTMASEVDQEGWKEVPTMNYTTLRTKYNSFDTLVLDCEGAIYNIMKDMPQIFDSIETIIIENDFGSLAQKQQFDEHLEVNGFVLVHSEANLDAKTIFPELYTVFHQVWTRNK